MMKHPKKSILKYAHTNKYTSLKNNKTTIVLFYCDIMYSQRTQNMFYFVFTVAIKFKMIMIISETGIKLLILKQVSNIKHTYSE